MRSRYISFGLILVLGISAGCSSSDESATNFARIAANTGNGDSIESGEDTPWYNRTVLRNVFGDFSQAPDVKIRESSETQTLRNRGEYLVNHGAACGMCHGSQPGKPQSPLTGGRPMQDRFGLVYAANITPDRETGVGSWNVLELMRAIRASIDRDGRPLSIDLHESYRWMSDQDAKAISLYLLSLPPTKSVVQRRSLGGFERNKWGLFPQHKEVSGYVPALPDHASAARGRYLASNVAQCGACHSGAGDPYAGYGGKGGIVALFKAVVQVLTPNRESYDEDVAQYLSPEGRAEYEKVMSERLTESEGEEVNLTDPKWREGKMAEIYQTALAEGQFPVAGPDIRGTSVRGLAQWSEADIVNYLSSGKSPEGEVRESRFCPWPYFAGMSDDDKSSIAQFLKKL